MYGRRHFASEPAERLETPPDAPARTSFALRPQGQRYGAELPDCQRCPDRPRCQAGNRANYRDGIWRTPFANSACEQALSADATTIVDLLRERPRTLDELAGLLHLQRDTMRRKLHALKPLGAHVIGNRRAPDALYAFDGGAPETPPSQRILELLRTAGPLSHRGAAERLGMPPNTALSLLRWLLTRGRVTVVGTLQIPAKDGSQRTVRVFALAEDEDPT